MAGYDLSSSVSESSAAKVASGGNFGDFSLNAGGQKQQSQLLLVLGLAVAGAVVVLIFFFRGRR